MHTDLIESPIAAPAHAREPSATPTSTSRDASVSDRAAIGSVNEFLTFRLGTEEYGIDILHVQEIRSYEDPTRIANAPGYILGVVNLRGVIVPIVDMRLRFGLTDISVGGATVTIVLSLGSRMVGIVVDSVSDVVTLGPQNMRPVPEFGAVVDGDHLHAIGVIDDRMLILVDILKLMGSAEMGLLA